MDIGAYIREFKNVLDPFILEYLRKFTLSRAEGARGLYALFMEAGRGGKCIRGALVKLGYEIAAGRPADEGILPAAAAFEVFQTGILAHDDIIDKSPLRRGKDALWRAAARGDTHYGVSQAICLGDVGIVLAEGLIAESPFGADRKLEALSVFREALLKTMDGEMLDVLLSREKNYGDAEGILRIAELKTAWYTVAGPMRLGAALAGAQEKSLGEMERFGIALGTAFQIRDDILGVRASESETGKSGASDIAEGKVTLLIHHALKNAVPAERRRLSEIYGRPPVSEEARKTVTDLFESTGAFSAAERWAEERVEEAVKRIPELTRDTGHAELLRQLSGMMLLAGKP
jgi:geranylgeranyl diphosphate synthase type I